MPHAEPPRSVAAKLMSPHLATPLEAGLAQSLVGCGVSGSLCTQGFFFFFFEPSKHLWLVWGLFLNTFSPLLPSCWGLSSAVGHGVSSFVAPTIC